MRAARNATVGLRERLSFLAPRCDAACLARTLALRPAAACVWHHVRVEQMGRLAMARCAAAGGGGRGGGGRGRQWWREGEGGCIADPWAALQALLEDLMATYHDGLVALAALDRRLAHFDHRLLNLAESAAVPATSSPSSSFSFASFSEAAPGDRRARAVARLELEARRVEQRAADIAPPFVKSPSEVLSSTQPGGARSKAARAAGDDGNQLQTEADRLSSIAAELRLMANMLEEVIPAQADALLLLSGGGSGGHIGGGGDEEGRQRGNRNRDGGDDGDRNGDEDPPVQPRPPPRWVTGAQATLVRVGERRARAASKGHARAAAWDVDGAELFGELAEVEVLALAAELWAQHEWVRLSLRPGRRRRTEDRKGTGTRER
ncbi:hypothetical protein GGR56DRAFT_661855 [Xylariaceae sp. FL0804]|nr:hypothetical protein GGR56DRAFT_661855 [Xylariaceae sp. FL0804]